MIRRLGVWKERQSFDRGLNEARVYRNLGIFFLRRGHFQDKNRARSFLKAALIPVSYTHLDVYKRQYVGRTFIKPKQSSRESAVRIKLNVLREAVTGKRVIMIDDSIVRGTTSDLIVHMLREAGAKEVHVRISAVSYTHLDVYKRQVLI